MAVNPVIPVLPVDPVGAVRRVKSGSTYFRHLNEWRIWSEIYAAERRAKERQTQTSEFAQILSHYLEPGPT